MRCSINRTFGLAGGATLVLVLVAGAASAECLPVYKPGDMVISTDLVLIGQEVAPSILRVEKVLKGVWEPDLIEVRDLADFGKRSSWEKAEAPVLTGRCVVFIGLRRGEPRVVANGVYRVRADGRLLGYYQHENPGGYELELKPEFPSMAALKEVILAAKAKVPALQADLMKQIAEGGSDLERQLHALEGGTCVGDAAVVDFVARRLSPDQVPNDPYMNFLAQLPDPYAFRALKDHYLRTKNVLVLDANGRQGVPAAREFLEEIARKGPNRDDRCAAFRALFDLHESLKIRGRTREALQVAETMFALYDEDQHVTDQTSPWPDLLRLRNHEE